MLKIKMRHAPPKSGLLTQESVLKNRMSRVSASKNRPIGLVLQSRSRRGSLETKEIIELILGVAVTILLAYLLIRIFIAGYDPEKEGADAYLDSLKKAVKDADTTGRGEFLIWQGNYYMIYFGDKSGFVSDNIQFNSIRINKNSVCICYVKDGKGKCKSCTDLKYPVRGDYFNEMGYASFVFKLNERMEIIKNNGQNYYSFLTPVPAA